MTFNCFKCSKYEEGTNTRAPFCKYKWDYFNPNEEMLNLTCNGADTNG